MLGPNSDLAQKLLCGHHNWGTRVVASQLGVDLRDEFLERVAAHENQIDNLTANLQLALPG
jgi:hypothetical protein